MPKETGATKNLNGTQLKAHNIKTFKAWIASMKSEDYAPMVYQGGLNKTDLEEKTGIRRKNFSAKGTVKEMLEDLEDELRRDGILPALTPAGKSNKEKPELDVKGIKAAREQSRVPALEQRILELEAEINALKEDTGRFSELSESLQQLSEIDDD